MSGTAAGAMIIASFVISGASIALNLWCYLTMRRIRRRRLAQR